MAYTRVQRKDKGFDFFNDRGQKVDVNEYVQKTGANKNQLIQDMANSGDRVSQAFTRIAEPKRQSLFAQDALNQQKKSEVFSASKILGDIAKAGADLGKTMVSGVQQGAGTLGDVALQGGAVVKEIGTQTNPFLNAEQRQRKLAASDRRMASGNNGTQVLRDAIHAQRDLDGNRIVGTSDVDRNAGNIAAGRGDLRDFAAVGGKALDAGLSATMFATPTAILRNPTKATGRELLNFAGKDAAMFGGTQALATGGQVYGQTGDLGQAAQQGLTAGAVAGLTQGALDGFGLGMRGASKVTPQNIGQTVNDLRPSVLAKQTASQDPRVLGYDTQYQSLAQRFDSLPAGSPERRAVSQAMAENRAARLAEKRGVEKGILQGGYIAGPKALGFKQAEEAGRVFDGVDGMKRFEVSDEGANLIWDNKEVNKVGDFLDHPELYKNYPELKDVPLEWTKSNSSAGAFTGRSEKGSYNGKRISLNADGLEGQPTTTKSTLIHELQHAIQKKEGFAKGGSPEQFINETIEKYRPKVENLPAYKALSSTKEKNEFILDYAKMSDPQNRLDNTLVNKYQNLAGEAEARAVQARMNMKDGERYVKPERPEVYYHGTNKEFNEFDINRAGTVQSADWGPGVYLTPMKEQADRYAEKAVNALGGKKITKELRLAPDAKMKDIYLSPGSQTNQALGKELLADGYDGARIFNGPSGDVDTFLDEVIVVNPHKLIRKDLNERIPKTLRRGSDTDSGGLLPVGGPTDVARNVSVTSNGSDVNLRSTFYDSLDVPKEDLIVRRDDGAAMDEVPKTVKVWTKSKFSDRGGYSDVPVVRRVDNTTLYQGKNAGEQRQFWTANKEYAKQFGDVQEKTGSFYEVDNGNRVTTVYVEAKPRSNVAMSIDPNTPKQSLGGDLTPEQEISAIYRRANSSRAGKLTMTEEKRIAELQGKTSSSTKNNPQSDAPTPLKEEGRFSNFERYELKDPTGNEMTTRITLKTHKETGKKTIEREILDANGEWNFADSIDYDKYKKSLADDGVAESDTQMFRRLANYGNADGALTFVKIANGSDAPLKSQKQLSPQKVVPKTSNSQIATQAVDSPNSRTSQNDLQSGTPDSPRLNKSYTDSTTGEVNITEYVKNQVKQQQKVTKKSVKSHIQDWFDEAKHSFVDDAVAYERYVKDKGARAQLREGVDRVRGSDIIARQFAEDNGIRDLGKLSREDLDTFQQYLIAKRSVELEGKGINTGRDLNADNSLIQSVGNRYALQEALVRNYSNKMLDYSVENGLITKELAESLKRDNPDYVPMNRIMDEVEAGGFQKTKQLGSLSKQSVVQKIKGSDKTVDNPIESLLKNTIRMVNEAERNKVAKALTSTEAFSENLLKDGAKPRAGYDTISLLDNGKKVTFEVPELVAEEMKNLNGVLPDWANTTLAVLGAPTRLLRTGATSANPIFAATNMVRDQLQTLVTGNSKVGIAGNLVNNIKGSPKAFVAAFSPGMKGSSLRKELSRNGIVGNEYRMTYGYKSGELIRELEKSAKLGSGALERLKNPINTLADIIGRTEYFTRAQQFYGAKGDIVTKSQSARNNTLNFSRAGSVTRILNRIIPFLNAGVQGGRLTVNKFRTQPVATTLSIATLTGVALAAKAMSESDEKRKALYDRIGEEEKKNNLILFSPDAKYNPETNRVDGLIKIPMPQMLYPFLDAVNNVKGKPEDIVRLAGDIFTATTGIDAVNPINQLTPTFAKPFAEAGLNKSFYSGNDLVSEYEKNLNPEDKGKKYSSGVAREVAKVTGIDAPKIDNFIGAWGGGLAKDATKGFSDNPDNNKDGGGPIGALTEGYGRRFASAGVTSQYDIQSKNATSYKDALKSSEAFKSLSAEAQAKALDKIDYDTKAIAGIASKTEQNRSDEIKRDLTSRQKSLLENGFDATEYLKETSTGVGETKLAKDSTPFKFLDSKPEMTDDEKKTWKSQTVSDEYKPMLDVLNKALPADLPKFDEGRATNAVAELYATFQKDKADKGWSELQEKKETKKLMTEAYKTFLSDNEKFVSTLSDKEILSAAQNGEISKEELENIITIDNIINKLGMSQMIGNKTRAALGYGTIATGSGSGGRRSGGRKASAESQISALTEATKTTSSTVNNLLDLLGTTYKKSGKSAPKTEKVALRKIKGA